MEGLKVAYTGDYINIVSAGPNNMKRKTHKRLRIPDIDAKVAERVDKRIDGPEPWMPAYSPELGGIPGSSHKAHRKFGHDLLTAGTIGIQEGGAEGIVSALTHLLLEAARDQIVKVSSEDGADIVEAAFNLGYDQRKKRRRKKNPRKKR